MTLRLSKAQRATLHGMFGGRCAYCGETLGERWHADHVEAVLRGVGSYWSGKPMARMHNDTIENMMPACVPCNISKASFTLDQWRTSLMGHVAALNAHHTPYRLARKYGLIEETGRPVTFYFETL